MLMDMGRKRGLIEQDLHPVLLLRSHLLYQLCRVTAPYSSRGAEPFKDQVHQLGGSPGWEITLSLLLLLLLDKRALPFSAAASWRAN